MFTVTDMPADARDRLTGTPPRPSAEAVAPFRESWSVVPDATDLEADPQAKMTALRARRAIHHMDEALRSRDPEKRSAHVLKAEGFRRMCDGEVAAGRELVNAGQRVQLRLMVQAGDLRPPRFVRRAHFRAMRVRAPRRTGIVGRRRPDSRPARRATARAGPDDGPGEPASHDVAGWRA